MFDRKAFHKDHKDEYYIPLVIIIHTKMMNLSVGREAIFFAGEVNYDGKSISHTKPTK
jgi:hypothetical protein